jgi:hypothetical protein
MTAAPRKARMLTAIQVAQQIFGWGESTFHTKLPMLKELGMPDVDPILGKYDGNAIDHWLDVRSKLVSNEPIVDREHWKRAAQDGRDRARRRSQGKKAA